MGEVAARWGEVVLRGEERWEGVGGRPPPSGGRDLPILGRIRSVSPSIFPCHDFATWMHRIEVQLASTALTQNFDLLLKELLIL